MKRVLMIKILILTSGMVFQVSTAFGECAEGYSTREKAMEAFNNHIGEDLMEYCRDIERTEATMSSLLLKSCVVQDGEEYARQRINLFDVTYGGCRDGAGLDYFILTEAGLPIVEGADVVH